LDAALQLACDLLARPSVTPEDGGCQKLLAERLQQLGFTCQALPFGQVSNLWARLGTTGPLLTFVGHTDVVPTGPLESWTSPPFSPQVRDGALYGRGAADMKSSIAAFTIGVENFVHAHPDFTGSIAFLITSDEEGPATDGTCRVMDWLGAGKEIIDYCIVGEPSSNQNTGDILKIGRRGSLGAELRIHGKQGHVAYPLAAKNPIHCFTPAMQELIETAWDEGDASFPPTTMQFSNLHSGTGATNVIPGELSASFNFRYSTAVTADELEKRAKSILDKYHLNYDLIWTHSALPFLTRKGILLNAAQSAILECMGFLPQLSTSGGTSDGRFIAPTGAEVIELGPVNASIHQVDEYVPASAPSELARIYQRILEIILTET